ncbi:MAG: flagellar basal body rod C-terminal domain-containing protein, partial [Aliarcobacter sp.]|nr:flagellar basal body rod C-terminal domain-containing protein [Aliarcobacter sp.]
PGVENSFEGRISIESAVDGNEALYKNESASGDAETSVSIGIFGKEITITGGVLKAQIDNLSTNSDSNKYQVYLDKLDAFAQTLSDISDEYIKIPDSNEYVYGEAAIDNYNDTGTSISLGLFSGASVKTLTFHQNSVNNLTQDNLDYLATIQWKEDISFDGFGQDSSSSKSLSLLEFFRELKVAVSADKENNDFLKETQDNVKQSIQTSYEQLTKVDTDEEMMNLIKFQAAYTANAKIVTAIDEMLQVLLNLKQ